MNPIRRHEMIMEVMLNQKDVTVNELSDKLQVTGKTIREDLSKLEEQGLIMRVHGGAVLAQSDQFGILPLRNPLDKYAEEKTEIARCALAHIAPDDIIALTAEAQRLRLPGGLRIFPLRSLPMMSTSSVSWFPEITSGWSFPAVTVSAICWPVLKPCPMYRSLIFKKPSLGHSRSY